MIPISICVIAKNEEKHMENFLSSIKNHFEGYPYELVIVDTGSTDKTVEIAKKYTNRVLYFEWIKDFSAARNFSIQKASHNWILVLDCDEYVTDLNFEVLQTFMEQHPHSTGTITRKDLHDVNNPQDYFLEQVERFFNRRNFCYMAPIHEQIRPLDGSDDIERLPIPVSAIHYGYAGNAIETRQKADRNLEILFKCLEDYPPSPYVYFQLGQSFAAIHDYEKACFYYEKGLEFDVDPQAEYVNLMVISYGHSLIKAGRSKDALQFENIYDTFAHSAEFVNLMGIIYMENNLLLKAMAEFLKATTFEFAQTAGENTYIPTYNMGCINERLGEPDAAIQLYQKCGNYPPALARLNALTKGNEMK